MQRIKGLFFRLAPTVCVFCASVGISSADVADVSATADASSSSGTETFTAGATTAHVVFKASADYTLSVATSGTGTGDASFTFAFGTPGSPELSSNKTITSGKFSADFSHTYDLTLAPFASMTFDSSEDIHADASANVPALSSALSSVISSGSQNITTDAPISVAFSGTTAIDLAVAGANPPERGSASYVGSGGVLDLILGVGTISATVPGNGSLSVPLGGGPHMESVSPSLPFSLSGSTVLTAQAVVPESSEVVTLVLAALLLGAFAYRHAS
jgi:hypothetical protein